MKQKLFFTLGLIVLGLAALAISPAVAQTVANGPYYANPSWDQTLPSSTRFIVLSNMNSVAVLDRETGLVWERSPSTITNSWSGARVVCGNRIASGRKGWRLPSLFELTSLVDPTQSNPTLPALPPGHPFQNVQPSFYWSATTDADDTSRAWIAFFGGGSTLGPASKSLGFQTWCVRGGMNADQY
jgi:hypothetical protein